MFPRIAIIHPDTLAAIGLKLMLQEVMPTVEVDSFRTVGELLAGGDNGYIHYFAATAAVTDNMQFFTERQRKTIVLSASAGTTSPIAGFHSICTSVPEKQLVRSLLTLEQTGHHAGRNLPPEPRQQNQLSAREAEVMSLIVKGHINKEIADMLNISLPTVITHRRNIMEKLGLKSVSALTIYAVTRGYVGISDI